jgi:hypothetical protein
MSTGDETCADGKKGPYQASRGGGYRQEASRVIDNPRNGSWGRMIGASAVMDGAGLERNRWWFH